MPKSPEEIREGLRDARKRKSSSTTDRTGENINRDGQLDSGASDGSGGLISGKVDGSIKSDSTVAGTQIGTGSQLRSLVQEHQRERSKLRRSGDDNSRTDENLASDTRATGRRTGRLIAADNIPERTFNDTNSEEALRPPESGKVEPTPKNIRRGRPSKEGAINDAKGQTTGKEAKEKPKGQFKYPGGEALTEAEAEKLHEPLVKALLDDAQYIDRYIWSRTGDSYKQPVWSDLSKAEAEVLARVFIRGGRRNVVVADAVRTVSGANDYISALMILGPRIGKTNSKFRGKRKQSGETNNKRP